MAEEIAGTQDGTKLEDAKLAVDSDVVLSIRRGWIAGS